MDTGADTASPSPALTRRGGDPVGDRAARAVFVAFFGSGLAFASWASRIPQVRDALGLEPGALGLVLLALAVGSVIALPVAGVVVARLGPARTILAMSVLLAVGLATVAVGHSHGVPPVVVGLFLIGFGNGTWDVAMNVAGRGGRAASGPLDHVALPRRVQPRHGRRGAPRVGPGRPPRRRRRRTCIAVAVVIAVAVPLSVRGFLPVVPHEHAAAQQARRHPLTAWTEPRTLLIGLFVLAMAFTEGTGNDWLGVAVIDGYHAAPAVGSLDVRGVRRRDDRRALVRPEPARPVRPRPGAAGLRPRRARRAASSSCSAPACRWPWPAPSCGGSAPRSASPSA